MGNIRENISPFAIAYKMFVEMEGNVEGSFLGMEEWKELRVRANIY